VLVTRRGRPHVRLIPERPRLAALPAPSLAA
jgi:hypothetical protein